MKAIKIKMPAHETAYAAFSFVSAGHVTTQ